jgi:hypothetical protein
MERYGSTNARQYHPVHGPGRGKPVEHLFGVRRRAKNARATRGTITTELWKV